jgi:uncharacterized protein (TIGR03118 family)
VAALTAGALASAAPAAAHGAGHRHHHRTAFAEVDLVSNQPGRAALTDPDLVNAWGMSHGPNTPLWVSDNGADRATLYTTPAGGPPVAKVPLVVGIPGGAPTGQVFNDTSGFTVPGTGQPALFIFASENGALAAWNRSVNPPTAAVRVGRIANGVFKGITLVHSPAGPRLLVADFRHGRVLVYNSAFHRLRAHGVFRDRHLAAGFSPFNVAEIGSRVYVSYAVPDAARHDDVPGAGHGVVDVFTTSGRLIGRLHAHRALNSPWGMAVAPPSFRSLAGDLLVGNFGDGRIHAFDRHSGRLVATLRDRHGNPIVIDGLWGLVHGDPMAGGTNALWFSAGPDHEANGLLGQLRAA